MALKISLMPIVSDGHGDLCASIEEMVVDSLRSVGVDIQVYSNPDDLKSASDLLLVGLGQWGRGSVREALREAPKYGVKRTLWQLETLPPPEFPRSTAARFLLRRTPDRVTGLARFADKLALWWFSRELAASLPGWRECDMDPRRLGLPFREARRIRALWRDGLLDRIVVNLASRQRFLQSIAVDSVFRPLGYHPLWGRPLDGLDRDMDAVFIGTPTPARAALLDRLAASLSDSGFRLTIVAGGCYGEQRTELLNRAKILIHLRNYPWELTRMRMMMAMGCKTLLVTEEFWDTKPFQPGKHLAMAPPEGLADTIIHYLRNEGERRDITEQAFNLVTAETNMGRLLAREFES